jgi:hypothetical protein
MATQTPEDFRDRALACEQRALTARDDPKMWLYAASGWRAVAVAEEAARRRSSTAIFHSGTHRNGQVQINSTQFKMRGGARTSEHHDSSAAS